MGYSRSISVVWKVPGVVGTIHVYDNGIFTGRIFEKKVGRGVGRII
jgi:hypothetical protein